MDPCTFTSWNDVFSRPAVDDYILAPGDYRGWGPCVIRGANPADRRRAIRFVDPEKRRPWDRMGSEAITQGFDFKKGSAHWILHGLTLRGPESACYVRAGAERITFDSLLIEHSRAYGVRLVGNHSTVQNSVVRSMAIRRDADGVHVPDGVGVQIKMGREPNVGNRVLDNEIYDCPDSIQVTWKRREADPITECVGLVVEGNDLYLTESRYTDDGRLAFAENGIDIKTGPRSPDEPPLRFAHNRIWGFRRSAPDVGLAAIGSAVTIHRAAQRILFERNVIFDCPIAFQEVRRDPEDPERGARDVTVRSNIISMMQKYHADDLGAVLRTKGRFLLEDNRFSRSATLSALKKLNEGDQFIRNVAYETPAGSAKADWDAGEDNVEVASSDQMTDVLVERRRWTNPDTITLRSAVRVGDPIVATL